MTLRAGQLHSPPPGYVTGYSPERRRWIVTAPDGKKATLDAKSTQRDAVKVAWMHFEQQQQQQEDKP